MDMNPAHAIAWAVPQPQSEQPSCNARWVPGAMPACSFLVAGWVPAALEEDERAPPLHPAIGDYQVCAAVPVGGRLDAWRVEALGLAPLFPMPQPIALDAVPATGLQQVPQPTTAAQPPQWDMLAASGEVISSGMAPMSSLAVWPPAATQPEIWLESCSGAGVAGARASHGSSTPTTCGSACEGEDSHYHEAALEQGALEAPRKDGPGRTAFLRRERKRRAKARLAARQSEPPCGDSSTSTATAHNAAANLRGSVRQLSFEAQGCRAVQAALQSASTAELAELVSELHGHVREAIESPHANYVIQKVVEALPPSLSAFVVTELRGVGAEVARHKFGCRVACRLLEHATNGQEASLVDEVLAEAVPLSRHTFGRHVVQSVLEHGWPERRERVFGALRGNLARCARNRNSSYVIEKALTYCSPEERSAMVAELLEEPGNLVLLARCQFGSHVVEAISRLPSDYSPMVLETLSRESALVCETRYGQRLMEDLGLA